MDRSVRILGIIFACFVITCIISLIITSPFPPSRVRAIFDVLFAVTFIGSLFFGAIFFSYLNKSTQLSYSGSRHISAEVRREVWRRDRGRCVQCGSQEKLEFDHIIPFSRGGSNTARNIQLLCEKCNRSKGQDI